MGWPFTEMGGKNLGEQRIDFSLKVLVFLSYHYYLYFYKMMWIGSFSSYRGSTEIRLIKKEIGLPNKIKNMSLKKY